MKAQCSGTMARILLKTHRKGFMLGKETVGGERVSVIQMSVCGRDGNKEAKQDLAENSGACGPGHFTQGKRHDKKEYKKGIIMAYLQHTKETVSPAHLPQKTV